MALARGTPKFTLANGLTNAARMAAAFLLAATDVFVLHCKHTTYVTTNMHDILYQWPVECVDGFQNFPSYGKGIHTWSRLLEDIRFTINFATILTNSTQWQLNITSAMVS